MKFVSMYKEPLKVITGKYLEDKWKREQKIKNREKRLSKILANK